MPNVVCKICGKGFYIKPSHQKRGWGKYCSIECRSKAQFNGKGLSCSICKKNIYRTETQQKRSKSGKFFCSKLCQTVWRNKYFSGEMSANWKDGSKAYRQILKRQNKIPYCCRCKLTDERILSVHHLDRDRKNNDVSNLVWICFNCHYLIHHDKSADSEFVKNLASKS